MVMKRIVLAAALVVWCTVLFADSIPDASRHIGQELIRFSQDISKFNSRRKSISSLTTPRTILVKQFGSRPL